LVYFEVQVAQNSYLSFGYGTDMTNTNEVAWIAQGVGVIGTQQTMYSTETGNPPVIPNEYITYFQPGTATFTSFSSTRPLAPGTQYAYSIPLDLAFSTVWAFQDNTNSIIFHDNNAGSVQITLPSEGGCVVGEVSSGYPYATLHGVLMWFAWSVLGVA
jgi:hypothetical protein